MLWPTGIKLFIYKLKHNDINNITKLSLSTFKNKWLHLA